MTCRENPHWPGKSGSILHRRITGHLAIFRFGENQDRLAQRIACNPRLTSFAVIFRWISAPSTFIGSAMNTNCSPFTPCSICPRGFIFGNFRSELIAASVRSIESLSTDGYPAPSMCTGSASCGNSIRCRNPLAIAVANASCVCGKSFSPIGKLMTFFNSSAGGLACANFCRRSPGRMHDRSRGECNEDSSQRSSHIWGCRCGLILLPALHRQSKPSDHDDDETNRRRVRCNAAADQLPLQCGPTGTAATYSCNPFSFARISRRNRIWRADSPRPDSRRPQC